MTKKMFKGLALLTLAFTALVFAGCANALITGGNVSGGTGTNTLAIEANNIPSNYAQMIEDAQNGVGRAIYTGNPYNLNSNDENGITWILSGVAPNGETFDDKVVVLANKTGGVSGYNAVLKEVVDEVQKDVTLTANVWQLTLTAYKAYGTEKSHDQPVLRGITSVDLKNGSTTATFNVSTKNLTTPGTVHMTGYFYHNGIVKSYEIGIYNAYTLEKITTYTLGSASPAASNAFKEVDLTAAQISNEDDPVSFEFGIAENAGSGTKVTVNAGAYLVRFLAYNGTIDDSTRKIVGAFQDSLVVDPGVHVDKELGTLSGISSIPSAPAKLYAYYVDGSEDVDGGYYNAKLVWDASSYQTCYEIELTEYQLSTDGTAVEAVTDSAKVYGLTAVNDTVDEDFAGAEIRYDGNVMSTSTSCTLKLPLGHLYDVRIRAANYVGQSEWTSRTKPAASLAVPDGTTVADADTDNGTKRLSRLRITYNLNGGSLWLDGSQNASDPDYTNTYINYQTWYKTDNDPALLTPLTTATSGKPYLTKGATKWAAWVENSTATTVTTYSYKNMIVTASFGDTIGADVNLTKYEDIDKADVTISYSDGTTDPTAAQTFTNKVANSTLDIIKWLAADGSDTATAAVIKVKLEPAAATRSYTDIACEVITFNGQYGSTKYDADEDGVCTINSSSYDTQVMEFHITAKNADNKPVSIVYYVNLK